MIRPRRAQMPARSAARRDRTRQRPVARQTEDRVSWIGQGIAAVCIIILGLGAAGAIGLTSQADDPDIYSSAGSASPETLPDGFANRSQGTSRSGGRTDVSRAAEQRSRALAQQHADVEAAQAERAIEARARVLSGAAKEADTSASSLQARTKRVMPLTSYRITGAFGAVGPWARYHTGVDFSAGLGTPIHAAAAGVVTHAGTGGAAGGWAGSYITIQHADGYQTLYAHMSPETLVRAAQPVSAGQEIGVVGLTGRTFGPHCHVELYPPVVRPGDIYRAVNVMPWLTG